MKKPPKNGGAHPGIKRWGNPTTSMLSFAWKSIIWQMLLCYGWLLDYLLEGHHNKSMKSYEIMSWWHQMIPQNLIPKIHSKLHLTSWRNLVRLPPWPWPGPAWNTALVSASHLCMAAKASSGKADASWMDKPLGKRPGRSDAKPLTITITCELVDASHLLTIERESGILHDVASIHLLAIYLPQSSFEVGPVRTK